MEGKKLNFVDDGTQAWWVPKISNVYTIYTNLKLTKFVYYKIHLLQVVFSKYI